MVPHSRERPLPEGMGGLQASDWLVPLAGLSLAFVLGDAVGTGHPPALDQQLLDWVAVHVTGGLRSGLVLVYRLTGKAFTPLLVLASIGFLAGRRRWRDLALVCASSGGILLLVDVLLKPHFDRPRPPEALISLEGHSFPSGHAAGAIAFYGAMVVIISVGHPRRSWPLGLLVAGWMALIWLSTLVVRAHWPSDLVAGGAVGLAWVWVCLAGWRTISWPPRR